MLERKRHESGRHARCTLHSLTPLFTTFSSLLSLSRARTAAGPLVRPHAQRARTTHPYTSQDLAPPCLARVRVCLTSPSLPFPPLARSLAALFPHREREDAAAAAPVASRRGRPVRRTAPARRGAGLPRGAAGAQGTGRKGRGRIGTAGQAPARMVGDSPARPAPRHVGSTPPPARAGHTPPCPGELARRRRRRACAGARARARVFSLPAAAAPSTLPSPSPSPLPPSPLPTPPTVPAMAEAQRQAVRPGPHCRRGRRRRPAPGDEGRHAARARPQDHPGPRRPDC